MSSFYSNEELESLGFKKIGQNALISRKASIYGASSIEIGNDVRIDDFCFLSGNIKLGNNIHISAYSALIAGDKGIELHDFSGLSSRCVIYAVSDDYSGNYLTNPTVSSKYTNVQGEKVVLEKHVIVGTGTSIMPGVVIHEGTSVGAMSLVTKSLDSWGVYIGIPCKRIKDRKKTVLDLENHYLNEKREL